MQMTIGDDGIASRKTGRTPASIHTRESEERELALWVDAAFTVGCAECNLEGTLGAEDALEASRGFYENGWRIRGGKPFCKNCVQPLLNEGTRYLKKDMGVWLD